MNPRSINSTNIAQFGFKVIADLENRKLIFDVAALTSFIGGGAANVLGVSFEVIDPAGVTIKAINFAPPDVDTNNILPYEVPLPSGMSLFGIYQIKGQIKEADGTIYEIVLPPKEICEPTGWDGSLAAGTFKETVDCAGPFIRLNETTVLTYLGKKYSSLTKVGNLYHPLGTINAQPFTRTPFQTAQVYTGDHVVRNKTLADYDLGDQFYVRVGYKTYYKFEVNCMSRLCNITCCLESIYNEYKNNCTTAKGRAAKEKIDEVTPLLFIATATEKCGKDASDIIAEIKKVLDCSCDDCNDKAVEPTPIEVGGGSLITMEGQCAATVTPVVEGDTTNYITKVKHVQIIKADVEDLAWTIERTEDDCNIYYALGFNYEVLSTTILNTIKNNSTLLSLFNTLVANIGVGALITGLDGKCIINLGMCDYILQESFAVTPALVMSITIDGVIYAAPGGLSMTDAVGIQVWLNGLGKGVWVVNYVAHVVPPGGVLTISSAANIYNIGVFVFTLTLGDVEPIIRSFIGNCKSLKDVLQAIIDYICNLSTLQVKLGKAMKLCHLSDKGAFSELSYGSGTLLSAYLEAIANEMCKMMTTLSSVAALTCAQMKAVFPESDAAIGDDDFVLMTKGGVCARGTFKELAIKIFKLAQTDVDVKTEFCAVDCGGDGACYSITDFVAETTATA